MTAIKIRYFHIYYYDDESKNFNVLGPITDDTQATNRTVELQEEGKKVRIFTTKYKDDPNKLPSLESLISNGVSGYEYDPNLMW